VEADDGLAALHCRAHQGDLSSQFHSGAVVDFGVRPGVPEHSRVHQGTGVDDDVGLGDELPGLERQQLGVPRSCADEIDHTRRHINWLLGGTHHLTFRQEQS